jgi:hypothetical protein
VAHQQQGQKAEPGLRTAMQCFVGLLRHWARLSMKIERSPFHFHGEVDADRPRGSESRRSAETARLAAHPTMAHV